MTSRLSVNINAESAAILRQTMSDRGWSTTECIRVAIGLLGYVETVMKLIKEQEETEDDPSLRSQ